MQKLNIPLGSNKTTRPKRRVVWTILFLLSAAYCGAWLTANWFNSSRLAKIAPEGTKLIVLLNPNRANSGMLTKSLADFPIITDRNLTYEDISSLVRREMAIYWLNDGTRALGLRVDPKTIPMETWNQMGVKILETRGDLLILSHRTVALNETGLGRLVAWPKVNWLDKKTTLGHLLVLGDKVEKGLIRADGEKVEISLKKHNLTSSPFKTVQEGIFAALSIPVWTNNGQSVMNQEIISFLQPLLEVGLADLEKQIAGGPGQVLLKRSGEKLSFLLAMPEKILSHEDWGRVIKLAAAVSHPTITQLELPDASMFRELRADPDAISIEEVQIGGWATKKVGLRTGEAVLATKTESQIVLSNDQELLEFYLEPKTGTEDALCDGEFGFIDLGTYHELVTTPLNTYATGLLSQFSKNFDAIGISSNVFGTKLNICY